MATPKSVIHIGLHKTGSTTLQQALYGSRNELIGQGFFYPGDYLPYKIQHSDLAILLRLASHDEYQLAMGRILADFAKLQAARLILSGEEFFALPRTRVEILRDSLARADSRFHVVLYVRNLYRFGASLIAQHSKHGKFLAYPADVMGRVLKLNLTSIVSKWESVFGEDNVHVFCLETLPRQAGIVTHFADFAGFTLPEKLPDHEWNRSVDPVASALLTHLAFEFGVPQQFFYSSYFQTTKDRFPVPRTEKYLNAMLDKWVAQVDVTHPKLAVHREILVRQPPMAEKGEGESAAEYLRALATTLTQTAKRMDARRKKAEPDGVPSGGLASAQDTPAVV